MRKIAVILFLCFLFFLFHFAIHADEYDDLQKQINDLKSALESSQKATNTNVKNLQGLNNQLQAIKNNIAVLEQQIAQKEKEVKEGEEAYNYQKTLLDQRTVSYYKNINKHSLSLVNMLISDNLSESLQAFFYEKQLADEDRRTITKIVAYIKNVQQKKAELQSETVRLNSAKEEVDKQAQFLAGEVAKSQAYEAQLSSQIAALTAKQQEILAQKLSGLNIPQSAYTTQGGCTDDRSVDPGFSPRYAFFTYGVPNRVGLNQYGAKGRAEAGQDYDQILRAYYNFDGIQDTNTGVTINVNDSNGYNSGNIIWSGSLEDYVKRIYEVPNGWPIESLKAQAVAARSYVLAATNNGSMSICANEYCQAFQTNPKGGDWEQAVNDTSGKVMIQGGQPIKAWFSSTHGGYVFASSEIGWSSSSWTKHATDTTTGGAGSFADLQSNAYDKGSPWFYCDWGSRAQYNKTAWLKPDEVADIANVVLLARAAPEDRSHLYQIDKPNPEGTDTWDENRVKTELRNHGTSPLNSVNNVSVSADFGAGKVNNVSVSGDGGSYTFSLQEFKDFFNLRAPANIQIVGPLFNIESR